MPWFKVDDGLSRHRKVLSIPRANRKGALGLWVLAGTWCAAGLTDGHVPAYMLDELACDEDDAKWLVYAGLWEDDPAGDGWWFHNWAERQPLREQVEARREVRAAAGRQGGIKSGQSRRSTSEAKSKQVASSSEASGEANASGVASTRTNPRPDPYLQTQTLAADSHEQTAIDGFPASDDARVSTRKTLADHFEEFYKIYPRKYRKRDAQSAWDKARKRASVEAVLAGAQRLAADPNLPTDRNFIPAPKTWLEGDGWEDEPLAPRDPPRGFPQQANPVRADGTVDADAILGRDMWQLPDPPPGIRAGEHGYVAWARNERDRHVQERQEAAKVAHQRKVDA